MHTVTIPISDEVVNLLNLQLSETAALVRLAAAVKFYEVGKLSSGPAAELAGIPRTEFHERLADFDVPTFRMTEKELQGDLARA